MKFDLSYLAFANEIYLFLFTVFAKNDLKPKNFYFVIFRFIFFIKSTEEDILSKTLYL